MAAEIVVPRLGWSMDEGVFSGWLKNEGELVEVGDDLFELESDKATQPVESFDSGILRLPLSSPKPGDSVKVGQCLGYLCAPGEEIPNASTPPVETSTAQSEDHSRPTASTAPIQTTSSVSNGETHRKTLLDPPASPSLRRLARQLGVDIHSVAPANGGQRISENDIRSAVESCPMSSTEEKAPNYDRLVYNVSSQQIAVSPRAASKAVQLGIDLKSIVGTGRSGRIRERDVLNAATGALPTTGETTLQPFAKELDQENSSLSDRSATLASQEGLTMRRVIAERMMAATTQSAQVTLTSTVDVTEFLTFQKRLKSATRTAEDSTPSLTAMFVKVVSASLQEHPSILHQWSEQGIVVPDVIDIAVAVDTPRGLLAPVLTHVSGMSLFEVSKQLTRLVTLARSNKITPEELRGGTFTISNLGNYAVDAFTPILNLPQSAILGIGRIHKVPAVVDDKIEIQDQVCLSLTFDHRVHDGAPAAAYFTTLCQMLKHPLAWLVD